MRRLTALLAVAMLTVSLAACGAHEHTAPTFAADLTQHWRQCADCDEKIDPVPHTLDGDGYCKDCGLSVWDYGDGTYSVTAYDEHGNLHSQTEYDANGNVTYVITREWEYDENGNPAATRDFHNGVLTYSGVYQPCTDPTNGEVYLREETSIEDDGSKFVSVYDENALLVSYASYDADGNLIGEDVYEYTYDEAGHLQKQICRTDGVISMESEFAVNADGNTYVTREVFYDASGAVVMENRYDAAGNVIP